MTLKSKFFVSRKKQKQIGILSLELKKYKNQLEELEIIIKKDNAYSFGITRRRELRLSLIAIIAEIKIKIVNLGGKIEEKTAK